MDSKLIHSLDVLGSEFVILYCTLTGNLSTGKSLQSGELRVIKVYSTVACCDAVLRATRCVGGATAPEGETDPDMLRGEAFDK